MKILLVDPAADWSTRDVYVGLRDGLRACGHQVIEFRSGRMLTVFDNALYRAWRVEKKAHPDAIRPTLADASLLMSERAVTWALRHEPDRTIVVTGMYFHPDALELARRAGLHWSLLLTETPYAFEREARMARMASLVWTNERTAVAPLRSLGIDARYLRHAYHPAKHWPAAPDVPEPADVAAHDVLFIGTGFHERLRLLSGVDWAGVDLGLYGAWPHVKVPGRGQKSLRQFIRGSIIGNADAAALYRRAAINLNLFRTSMGFGPKTAHILGAESLGPRAYELAACGAFTLSERRPEIAETFGDLVPTFGSAEELSELVRRWLPDLPGRRAMAAALPAAVRGHSWVERAEQVVSDLRSAGGAGLGPFSAARDASLAAQGEPLGTSRLELV